MWVLLGFGITAILTTATLFVLARERRAKASPAPLQAAFVDGAALRLVATWAVVGIAIAYVPVAFQRKLLMGAHLPLCVLAGVLITRFAARLSGDFPKIALVSVIALSAPTNLWFLVRDTTRIAANVGSTDHRPYLTRAEADALAWLRKNTDPRAPVLVAPDPTAHLRFPFVPLRPHLSVYVPALAGNVVFNGHWGETAFFGRKLAASQDFFRADTSDDERIALLRENGIRYVLHLNALSRDGLRDEKGGPVRDENGAVVYPPVPWPARAPAPPYLRPVYENADITIYEVHLPA
jgi:hypothetical protein